MQAANKNTLPVQVIEREGKPVVDSRIVADGLGIKHKALLQTIGKHKSAIEEQFGQVAFEMRPGYNNAQVRVAHLTDDQFTFIASLSKNTTQVVAFKARLIKEFRKMHDALAAGTRLAGTVIQRRWLANAGQVPMGYFSMLFEAVNHFALPFESHYGHTLADSAVIDIALGKGFCSHLRSKGIDPDTVCRKYAHRYPDGRIVQANAYPMDYYQEFYNWFRYDWMPHKAAAYLSKRDVKALEFLPKMLGQRDNEQGRQAAQISC